jgi:D-tyrosyl-tRNA(Tyr) deacylase
MKAVVQRVKSARVTVSHETTGAIEHGLLVYLGVGNGDGDAEIAWLAKKILALRIFEDEHEKMNRSVVEAGGSILVVSQFTLYADVARGNRPSFGNAAPPALAEALYLRFVEALSKQVAVATGRFRADMRVESVGYGPVTICFDTKIDAPTGARPDRTEPADAAARFVATLKGDE